MYRLNSPNEKLNSFAAGDIIYAATLAPSHALARDATRTRAKTALCAKFVVSETGRNSPEQLIRPSWKYYFEADPKKSQFYSLDDQQYTEEILRNLLGRSKESPFGQSFQGSNSFVPLTSAQQGKIEAYAASLPLSPINLPPAAPDDQNWAVNGETGASDLHASADEPSVYEMMIERRKRNQDLPRQLRRLYDGTCQICGEVPFRGRLGDLAEAHHIDWLSKGGQDKIFNMVLLCPNHHAAVHMENSYFDWRKLEFTINKRSLILKRNLHLQPRR